MKPPVKNVAAKYERFVPLRHLAIRPEELSKEEIRGLRTAQTPPEAVSVNKLMD